MEHIEKIYNVFREDKLRDQLQNAQLEYEHTQELYPDDDDLNLADFKRIIQTHGEADNE